jgi:hypothetical protein
MDLCIDADHTLEPGRFHAIVAPVETILAGLNDNQDLQRYTMLFICSNYSRVLDGIKRTSGNFSLQRPFTVHQLMTVLKENTSSIVFVEFDSSLFDQDDGARKWVAQIMRDVSRETLFAIYSPTMTREFSYLCAAADHVIIYDYLRTTGAPEYQGKPKREVQQTLLTDCFV